jgi:hypothetical protein
MTKVRMLQTAYGSPDGLRNQTYMEGGEYDLPDALVQAFFEMGVCEMVTGDIPAPKHNAAKRKPVGRA